MGSVKSESLKYLEHVPHWRATIFVLLCWFYVYIHVYDFPLFIFTWPFFLALGIAGIRLFIWGKDYKYTASLKDCESLKRGDIVLIGNKGVNEEWYLQLSNVLSHPIKDRFWTHVGIYEDNGRMWEALPRGVSDTSLESYMREGYLVRALRHRMISDDEVFDELFNFCRKQKMSGRRFEVAGSWYYLLATITPIGFNYLFDNPFVDRLFKVENGYFCSEMVVDAFKHVGYPITSYDGWRVKPADFIGNPILEEVKILTPAEMALKVLNSKDLRL